VVTVKPYFTIKMIDCVHQTGLTKRKLESLGMSPTCSMITMSITVSVAVVKIGSYSSPNLVRKPMESIAGISYCVNRY